MKAMRKASRGKGVRGVLDYVFFRDEDARQAGKNPGILIGGNMSGLDPRSLSQEFGVSRRVLTKRDIEKPCWHQALRLPRGEKLLSTQFAIIADDYMERMGFTDAHMRCCVMHDDQDGQHVHIIASRVGLDGKVWLGKNENLQSTSIVRELEQKYGLAIAPEKKQEKANPSKNEIEKALRTGKRPAKLVIQKRVDEILLSTSSLLGAADFVGLLKAYGVEARANIARTGKFSGFSFAQTGHLDKAGQQIWFKGSDLGKSYTAQGLANRGLQYVPSRDMPILTGLHPQPAENYTGEPKIQRRDGGREFSLIIFMRYEPVTAGGQLYRWQSGAPAFFDHGNEITLAGRISEAKIRGMLDLAREKGWSKIELSGSKEFQLAVALEAARRGILVTNNNENLQELWRNEHERRKFGADTPRDNGPTAEQVGSSQAHTRPKASSDVANRADSTGIAGYQNGHEQSGQSDPNLGAPTEGDSRGSRTDNGKENSDRDTPRTGGGLKALKQAPRPPAGPNHRSDAAEEERPVRVTAQPEAVPEPTKPRSLAPGPG